MNKEQEDLNLANCVKMSVDRGWGYSSFKNFVSQFVLTENDEEQWQFDFESYVLSSANKYEHPGTWGLDYYNNRWDIRKYNKFIKELSPNNRRVGRYIKQ